MSSVFVFIRSRRENYSEENTTRMTRQSKNRKNEQSQKYLALKNQDFN